MGQLLQFPGMAKKLDNPPNRIRELRIAIGKQRRGKAYTQVELGEALGYAHQQIGRWETGERPIYDVQLRRIADFLGVPLAQMLTTKDNPYSLSDEEQEVVDSVLAAMRSGDERAVAMMRHVAEGARSYDAGPAQKPALRDVNAKDDQKNRA
ncbi:helix-turn-helix domain-containing protein [Stakelama pacifica]|uniref:Helix-turn-helix protein n=1 Tax=Stakelama pacifica TaxID=517720 RepID=A0A4R6FNI9_9SPHN|nr:helix-turn-helix transcriptional regulator [Stakelama pacifica]TDN83007.1 helix-turn-helix protein [Stakelama pacifica]GGO94945.1 hypothetical protein GCM10011329_17970 [Stakelama pacifica]